MSTSPRDPSALEQSLAKAIAPALAPLGVDLEGVDVSKAGRRQLVRIVVDADGGVDLDKVADVSRLVSDLLDDPTHASMLPGPFVLEVSSPGVDRPLTDVRHWRRAQGRLVSVTLDDDTTLMARIVGVKDDGTVVVSDNSAERVIDPAHVKRAVVQVEFDAPAEQEGM